MKNLQEATERICELKGSQIAMDAFVPAVVDALSKPTRARLLESFDAYAEAARTVLLHTDVSDVVLTTFERDVARNRALVQHVEVPRRSAASVPPVDALLLSTTHVLTFAGERVLTSASGFFFRRGEKLFLVSNRHVFADAATSHFPDRVEIGLHTNPKDLTQHTVASLPLYRDGFNLWREATDTGGKVDVAAIEIPASDLPADAVLHAFDESHLEVRAEEITIGDALTIAGFPMDFHDTVHHLAVARSASIASAYGVRFQRQGCFLTDARTHRGSSGSPVVRRRVGGSWPTSSVSWQLLGVHSTRMDMRTRDQSEDEALGLNCAWYADVLLTLTADG
ncbi:MAG: trypsin-like peptidase domain-containing protein [Burkholderiales bacterium]|jgi:S1-C subfamily serine protease|nr:trypsin-like peptidase domain-containing protein [Burkholderiales bacterium]